MAETSTASPFRLPIFAIIPCPDPVTGGVQADLAIVDQLRLRGWTVHPIFFADVRGMMPRYGLRDQLLFNLRLIRRLRREPAGFILLEDQALSGAVALANIYARRRRGARVALVTYHLVFNLWRNPLRRWGRRIVEGMVARGADIAIASSESTRRELREIGVPDERSVVVPLGVRTTGAVRQPASPAGHDGSLRLLTVGTVEPRKGLEYLIRALAALPDRSWVLDVVGTFDPEHHRVLVELLASLGEAERVRFHGRVSDEALDQFLADADVYVSPSLGEGFGLAVLEAMGRGLPVVVSEAGALPELVEDGRTGLLVPPADVPALTDALLRIMDDAALRRRMGQNAAGTVAGRYSWEQTGGALAAALLRLCEIQPAAAGPMRVCHVIHSGAVGGGPGVLSDCVELAARDGFDNVVICGADGPLASTLRDRGVTVHTLAHTGKWSFVLSIPTLIGLFQRERAGVVLLYGQFAGFYGAIASRLARVRAIYQAQFPSFRTDHGILSRVRNHVAEWVACRLTDETSVLSDADRREYIRRRLQTPARLHLIPNGVDIGTSDLRDVSALRQELLGDGTALLLAAGRMEEQKGFDVLLRALPHVLHERPGTRLALVGEGTQREALVQLIAARGLGHAVSVHPFQSDLDAWIRAADVVVVPSRYEPGGIIAREAMAAGRAVVASDVQGLGETIENGRTGILVPPEDEVRLEEAVLSLLFDDALRDRLAQAARQTAEERFSREAMWAAYESLIRRLRHATRP